MQIIKIPYINALGKTGPEKAPNMVLKELKKNYSDFDGLDFEEVHIDNNNVEESEELIYKNALGEFGKREGLVFVGGDHSITSPIVRAFAENFGAEQSFLIVFDAHADCDYCVKEATHEEWLRAIVERGWFKPKNIILIGVRRMWDVEKKFLAEKGIKVFSEINAGNLEAVGDYITEKANEEGIEGVYVSVDIDVLEPAVAPGVNVPEVNGLTSRELFYLLRRVFHVKNLRAIDIVEIVPDIDEKYENRTIKIGAKILQEYVESVKNGRRKS